MLSIQLFSISFTIFCTYNYYINIKKIKKDKKNLKKDITYLHNIDNNDNSKEQIICFDKEFFTHVQILLFNNNNNNLITKIWNNTEICNYLKSNYNYSFYLLEGQYKITINNLKNTKIYSYGNITNNIFRAKYLSNDINIIEEYIFANNYETNTILKLLIFINLSYLFLFYYL